MNGTSHGYRGRFAPSPTGPLHAGSLIAAVASYLDARANNGTWVVRMEDVDTPRAVPGAADAILSVLAAHGMHSDEPVMAQSKRAAAYQVALDTLIERQLAYPCSCSRREIADSAVRGVEGPVYTGRCRLGPTQPGRPVAWRLRTTDERIVFLDGIQGRVEQHVQSEIGDFVLKRADGLFAYQLAAVADDAAQGITHVVRGADLLHSTPRQIYLQNCIGVANPAYLHVPVLVNAGGEKLSKQTGAAAINPNHPLRNLKEAMTAFGFVVPKSIDSLADFWAWAVGVWSPLKVRQARVFEWRGVGSA